MGRVATFGLSLLASSVACATAVPTHSTVLSESVTAPRPVVRASSGELGSRIVLEAPLTAGPRVSIRAEVSNEADARRVRAIFRTEDDAYVIVGHIDADGVLRIAFPNDPGDDGFVRGNRSYSTNEFFAGFNSQYRFRARTTTIWNSTAQNSYDGGFGYVFVVAAWRPMRFDQFSDGYHWDTFDLASDNYMNDPRPAIQELASRLAGPNGDAYTIQFARYYNTEVVASGYDSWGYNSFASAYGPSFCSGYEPLYGSLGYVHLGYPGYAFAYNGWYRGSRYYYDSFGDCYRRSAPYGFAVGYHIVQLPVVPPPRTQPRILDVDGHRPRPVPQPLPGHLMPLPAQTAPGETQVDHPRAPEYRQRTDPTENGNGTSPVRRQPRIEAPAPVEHRERPVYQEPQRRAEPRNEQQQPRMILPERVERPRPNSRADNPRLEGPRPDNPRPESPRVESPRAENPRSEARPESPRMAAPRSEPSRPQPSRAESPKPEIRSEPPRSAAPRSEPAKPDTRKPPR